MTEHTNLRTQAHPTIPVVLLRADMSTYPGVSGVSVGIDLNTREARKLAAELVVAADEIDARTCTGQAYPVNPDAPDEGIDIHHDGPCAVHGVI